MLGKFVSAACLAALTLPNCAAADECPPHHCKLPKDDAALEAVFASAETSVYSEQAYFDEIPLVLSASRVAQSPLDAPAPVTVIDRDTIRASGFNEVHDLLRLVPGFLIADVPDGPPIVVNHGLGDARGRRLQVLIDGRSIYNPFSGAVDWQSLPIRPDDIERIEVVRGPNPATYGANSFQGVVNIITRSPHSEEVEKHYFTETLFSPRLAANYALTANQSLRASAGRGYRAPTAFEEKSRELYPYRHTVADVGYWSYQHLQAEQVNFREIGYVGQLPEYGVRLDARLFREDYRNYIDDQSCQLGGGTPACLFAPPPGYRHILGSTKAYVFVNSGAIRSWGEELQLDWRNAWLGRLLLGYSRTYIDAEASVDRDVPRAAPRRAAPRRATC